MASPIDFLARIVVCCLAAVLLDGCGQPSYVELGSVERAALITKLRKEAGDCLAIWRQSSGEDVDALKRYVELHGETTKVEPQLCARCYLFYGTALSRLGLYYRDLVGALRKELEEAPASEREELEKKIAHYQNEVTRNFQLSNQQFEIYFRSGETIDPNDYLWVLRQHEALGEYRQALFYLDLIAANVTLTEDLKQKMTALRRSYEMELRVQEEKDLRRELGESAKSPSALPGETSGPQPGN